MEKCDSVDGLAAGSEVHPVALPRGEPLGGGRVASGVADALPRGQGNWKCGRTSCSWETFCLVVCSQDAWLWALLPRPLDLGKATARVLCLDPRAVLAL